MSFWDFFWIVIWGYLVITYMVLLLRIASDLFRDPTVTGGGKALWTVGLIVLPFITALIYLYTRGQGMAERQIGAWQQNQDETEKYIRSVAGTASPVDQIASAKALLDSQAITATEFDKLKAAALA